MRYQDLANATLHGPDPVAMTGPVLSDVNFPDVLVAKAYSHEGKGLDMVLYPGKAAGTFTLGFDRLQAGKKYDVAGRKMTADGEGKANVDIKIDGRTPVILSLV